MFDPKIFDDIAKRLSEAVPQGIRDAQADLEQTFRSILQVAFSKLDLVTRDEFDTQTKVLARTRAKLDEMEQHIAKLEEQVLAQPTARMKTTKDNKKK